MIRVSYIHEYDMFDEVTSEIQMNESYIDKLIRDYDNKCEEIRFRNMMESSDTYDSFFTEGVVEVIEKIGENVQKVIKKVIDLIEMCVDKFREFIWSHKSDSQKIEAIVKKHPNLADEIKLAFTKGELEVKDIKSLQEVLDGTYDIVGKLKKGKIEPSKAEEMFDNLISKWSKYGKPVLEIVGGVTTALSAFKVIHSIYPDLCKQKYEGKQTIARLKELEASLRINEREERGGEDTEHMKRMRCAATLIHKACSHITSNTKGQMGIFKKVNSWFSAIENKVAKMAIIKNDNGDDINRDYFKNKEKENLEKAQKRNSYIQSTVKRTEQKQADNSKSVKSHREEMKDVRDRAYHQQMGKAAANRDNSKQK